MSYWKEAFEKHQQKHQSTRGQEAAESGKTLIGAKRLQGQLAKVYGSIRPSTGPTPEQIRATLTKKP